MKKYKKLFVSLLAAAVLTVGSARRDTNNFLYLFCIQRYGGRYIYLQGNGICGQ